MYDAASINAALKDAFIPYAMRPDPGPEGRAICAAIPGTHRAELYPVVYFSAGFTPSQIIEHCRDAAASI